MTLSAPKQKITLFHLYLYRGGGERVLVDLANGFAERGYAVDLVLMRVGGPYMREVSDSVRVIDFKSQRILSTLPKLIRYLRHERPAALLSITKHTHLVSLWARTIAGVPTKIVLRIGIPFSLFLYRGRNYREYLLPFLIRMFYRFADAIVANSRGLAEDFIRVTGMDHNKVTVIYNPKDVTHIKQQAQQPVAHPWLADKKEPVIIASGRLTRQKGFDVLITALARVRTRVPAKLIILGSGGSRAKWQALAREVGVAEHVAFEGFVENPYAYLARADVFALSSRWEGLPNVLIEALVCGLPAVATDCPHGPREILAPNTSIDQQTRGIERAQYGMLVPVDDANTFADALTELLTDDAQRTAYVQKASTRGEDFDSAAVISAYERLFTSCT